MRPWVLAVGGLGGAGRRRLLLAVTPDLQLCDPLWLDEVCPRALYPDGDKSLSKHHAAGVSTALFPGAGAH